MAQMMTGKQALLEMLKAEGVDHIFGNPGTSEGPIIDLLGDYPELRYFLTLQESVAMGMGEVLRACERPGILREPARGQRTGQRHCPDAGRAELGDSDGGDLGQLRHSQNQRDDHGPGAAGAAGHQVGRGTVARGPDTERHAEGVQRGEQPPEGSGVRRVHLQCTGGDGRDEYRAITSRIRRRASQRRRYRTDGGNAARRQQTDDAGGRPGVGRRCAGRGSGNWRS